MKIAAIHPAMPDFLKQLTLYGMGYHSILCFLDVAPHARGILHLAPPYVTKWCLSEAIVLLREEYGEKIVGVRFVEPVDFAKKLHREFASPLTLLSLMDTADKALLDWTPNIKEADLPRTKDMHRVARDLLKDLPDAIHPIIAQLLQIEFASIPSLQ